MIFNSHSRFNQIVLGIILGAILIQTFEQTAKAQFGGPVTVIANTSPTEITLVANSTAALAEQTAQTAAQLKLVATSDMSFLSQVAEYVKEGLRWVETVTHYTNVIFQAIRQFTTLKGILGVIEKQLGLDDDSLKALADIGQIVRGCFALKNQFMAMVNTRLSMLKNIYTRAQNGIFDPQADLNDLEDYLRNTIGRSAQDVIANRERLARFDNELERWTYELGLLRAKKAALSKQRDETKQKLEEELNRRIGTRDTSANNDGNSTTTFDGRVSASAQAIESMKQTILTIEGQITELDKQISDLVAKITERYKKYHMKFDESKITADTWEKEQEGWDNFMQIKEDAIERMIDNYGQQYETPTQP